MAMALKSGAGGISYVLITDDSAVDYMALMPDRFVGCRPEQYVEAFGGCDPILNMLGLAAINAICQQVMRFTGNAPGSATDSLGLMQIRAGALMMLFMLYKILLNTISSSVNSRCGNITMNCCRNYASCLLFH